METLEYTRIICEIWTYWDKYPEEFTHFEAFKRDVKYILYRITGKKWFITKNDSDLINTIMSRLSRFGSEFAYEGSQGLLATGSFIGGLALGTLGAIDTFGGPLINQASSIVAGAALGSYYGGQQAYDMGNYPRINSNEEIYDMIEIPIINDPNSVFDQLIEIFRSELADSKYLSRDHLPNTLEYIIRVFDLMSRWSGFEVIENRFLLFGELYIDPILRRIANPQIPRMVRELKTLRELSSDAVAENYRHEDIISELGEELYSQATSNFRY